MSFPRDRGELSPQVYSTLLLIAAVRQHGGELRIPVLILESVKGGESILHDFDHGSQELVLRCGSASANLLALPQEEKWQAPKATPSASVLPLNNSMNSFDKPRSTLDDGRAAEIERQQSHERNLSQLKQRRNDAMHELFSTNLDEALRKTGNATG